jgi:hypothetical protein
MIEDTYIELIHKEIDGIIEPHEQAKLYGHLNNNPEAQVLLQDLKQTTKLLDSVEDVEPPTYLKHQIMQQVHLKNRYRVSKTSSITSWITNFITAPGPKLTYAFALGIVAGIFIYALLLTGIANKNPLNNGDLTGTIGINNTESLTELKNMSVELSDLNGTIDVKLLNDRVLIDLNLNPSGDIDLLINYEPSDLNFLDFKPSEVSKSLIEIDSGMIRMTLFERCSYQLSFKKLARKTVPIKLSIIREGQIQLIQNITIPRAELY